MDDKICPVCGMSIPVEEEMPELIRPHAATIPVTNESTLCVGSYATIRWLVQRSGLWPTTD